MGSLPGSWLCPLSWEISRNKEIILFQATHPSLSHLAMNKDFFHYAGCPPKCTHTLTYSKCVDIWGWGGHPVFSSISSQLLSCFSLVQILQICKNIYAQVREKKTLGWVEHRPDTPRWPVRSPSGPMQGPAYERIHKCHGKPVFPSLYKQIKKNA